jgi:hypothetical protein
MGGNLKNSGGGHIGEHLLPKEAIRHQSATGDITGQTIDREKYNVAQIVGLLGNVTGTTPALALKIQHGDESDLSDAADLAASTQIDFGAVAKALTDADENAIFEFIVDLRKAKRYIRIFGTLTGSSTPTFPIAVAAILAGNVEGLPV